ncbi:SWF or SNF family helicase [Streptomyces yokosukanensis]|uniref:SWF or SNF family helicase n=1 Tax=Streptomyces yokosukanensis TaxID=67386 RepID=A0A101P771_9ACTN|nr:SWF or SNF family helicase [Streptomyces yokosukanensis]KUN06158.1 SWF or SNF family helicase [Streptomyces yokosukanensis]
MNRYDDGHGRAAQRTVAAPPPARGRGFAQGWWGRAWLRALEDAALDGAAVKAGRRLAREGGVGAVTVRPGRVTAVVRDARGAAHRADVLVPELSEAEWGRLLDTTVGQAGHLAALLDGELPPHLIEDAAVGGVELLPGLGDLEPECDCGTWDHCGHTAALCHQVARLLDEDPFLLLLLRGREKDAFLAELHLRSTAPRAATSTPATVGVDASEAWAAGDILPPLPPLPGLPQFPGTPPPLTSATVPAPGMDPAALEHLAGRTAMEAYRLLAEVVRSASDDFRPEAEASRPDPMMFRSDPEATRSNPEVLHSDPRGHRSDPWHDAALTAGQDAVRLACGAPCDAVIERLAKESGRGRAGLATAVRAWCAGGVAALAVLDEEWQVEGLALAHARAALEAAWEADERPPFHSSGNRWTVPDEGVQLRLGRDGLWWPYRDEAGGWVPAGGPDRDPATALASARLDADSRDPERL